MEQNDYTIIVRQYETQSPSVIIINNLWKQLRSLLQHPSKKISELHSLLGQLYSSEVSGWYIGHLHLIPQFTSLEIAI